MENRFEKRNGELFINGKKVLHGWESFSGWYWFAVEKVQEQVSNINGRPVNDTIWYGLVQGFEEEWGDFSQAELESLHPKIWKIPHRNLPWAGRRAPGNPSHYCEAEVTSDECIKCPYRVVGLCDEEVKP